MRGMRAEGAASCEFKVQGLRFKVQGVEEFENIRENLKFFL